MEINSDDFIKKIILATPQIARCEWEKLIAAKGNMDFTNTEIRFMPEIFSKLQKIPPFSFFEILEKKYLENFTANQIALEQVKNLVSMLNSSGVDYVLLKGVAILLYSRVQHPRVFGDVDILIHEEDLESFHLALTRLGYKYKYDKNCPRQKKLNSWQELCYSKANSFEIDVHIARHNLRNDLFSQIIKANRQILTFQGVSFNTPDVEFMMLHSLLHSELAVSPHDFLQGVSDFNFLIARCDKIKLLADFSRMRADSLLQKYSKEHHNVQLSQISRKFRHSVNSLINQTKSKLFRYSDIVHYGVCIIGLRRKSLIELIKVTLKFNGRRFLYLIWLMLGQIRIIESCFPKFLSPSQKSLLENTTRVIFSDSRVQGFVSSSVALVVGDWRFRVSFPENLRKVNLIFNDFTLSNSAYAVFVNGELYGTTSGCDSRYEIRIDNPCCDYEISFRSPAHACSKCGDDLSLMLIEIVLENM